MKYLWYLTIVIPRLPCLFSMANAVLLTIVLVNLETSDSLYSLNFAKCALASKCFIIELVPCSHGWRRSWCQTIHMMPRLPVSSSPQCKLIRHEGACLEKYQPIECFEPTFIEAHQVSNMISKARSLKSRIKTHSSFEDIITPHNTVFTDCESDMVVGIWNLRNSSLVTVKSYGSVELNAGSEILTLELHAGRSKTCETLHALLWSCMQEHIEQTDR